MAGGFNFRPVTEGIGLFLHPYGIAIDWDPDQGFFNPDRLKQKCLADGPTNWLIFCGA